MSWEERLQEAAYTSPSGQRVTFDYEDVRQTIDKKTSAFEFPDVDGTYVQDLGHSGRRFPLRLFFWGEDYDLDVAAFEAALLEKGAGKLEHPIYGTRDVVPFGTLTRRDDLKNGANQAVYDVAFWETTGLEYPSNQSDPASTVLTAVKAYNDAAAEEFEEVASLTTAVEQASFLNAYNALLAGAESTLAPIAAAQDDVRSIFNTVNESINQGIDVLVAQPLTLAFQTLILLQAPARAATLIADRLDAYKNLADEILGGPPAVAPPSNDAREANRFHVNSLYASTYVTGSIVSVINTEFSTRAAALTAAEGVLDQLRDVTEWRDANLTELQEVDTGGAYQRLQEAAALTAGFLVEISFSLQQERRFTVTYPRTILDLCAELYGEVDERLDFFINSNELAGTEILEVPRGREIVYYV